MRTVTLTATGSERVRVDRVDRVHVTSETGDTDDFRVSSDTCAYPDPGPGASCRIGIRFAPSEVDATSTARLEIGSDLPGPGRTVDPSGVSTTLPQGPPGITGPCSPAGAVGISSVART